MSVAVRAHPHEHHPAATPPERPRGLRRWTVGGWLRVLWVTPLSFALATALVLGAFLAAVVVYLATSVALLRARDGGTT